MKQVVLFYIFAGLWLIQSGFAQQNRVSADSAVVITQKLWLYNSAGKVAGDQDSVILKDYFNTKWVDIQSDVPFGRKTSIRCLVMSKGKPHSTVYHLSETKLSPETMRGITDCNPGSTILFLVEENNEETGIKVVGQLMFKLL